MSSWLIALWAAAVICVCLAVISVVLYKWSKRPDHMMDSEPDIDMLCEYSMFDEEKKQVIRDAVRDMSK